MATNDTTGGTPSNTVDAPAGGSTGAGGAAIVVDASGSDAIVLPDGMPLTLAEFGREGGNLVLEFPDGSSFVVRGYFDSENPPELKTPEGAVISGELASRLAGPEAPGQVAQAGPELSAEPIGQVEKMSGTVTATRADGTKVELKEGDPVFQGDILETSADGGIGVILADETTFSMAESGRMVLDEMVYDPGTQEGSVNFSVVQGVFTFVSGQVAKADPDAMQINTPVATIGIRGTQVGIEIPDGQNMNVVLMEEADGFVGEVVIMNGAGSVVMNMANDFSSVGNYDSPPSAVITIEEDDMVDRFVNTLTHLPTDQSESANDFGLQSLDDFETAAGGEEGQGTETAGVETLEGLSDFDSPDGDLDRAVFEDAAQGLDDFETAAGGNEEEEIDVAPVEVIDPTAGQTTNTEEDNFELDTLVPDTPDAPAAEEVVAEEVAAAPPDPTVGYYNADGQFVKEVTGGEYDGSDIEADQLVTGGEGDEHIITGAGDDVIEAGGGDDTITGGGGSDEIRGSSGEDTAIFDGNYDDYVVEKQTDDDGNVTSITLTRTVTNPATGEEVVETDTLTNVENLTFDNGTVTGDKAATPPVVSVSPGTKVEGTGATSFDVSVTLENPLVSVTTITLSGLPEGTEVVVGEETVMVGENGTVDLPVSDPVTGADGTVSYTVPDVQITPPEGSGDGIPFTAGATTSDGKNAVDDATVDVNDAPTPGVVVMTTTEDTPVEITAAQLLAGAEDPEGDALSVVDLTVDNGTLVENGEGSWLFTPDKDESGNPFATLSYGISDGVNVTSTTAPITVEPINDIPTTGEVSFTMQEDGTMTITSGALLAQARDVDGDVLAVSDLQADDGSLTLDLATGIWTFTPDENFNGDVNLSYGITDGVETIQTNATITVEAVNDGPTADAAADTTGEDALTVTIDLADKVDDVEDADGAMTISVDLGDNSGWTATVDGTVVTLTAAAGSYDELAVGESADITGITYTVTDSEGAEATAAIGVTVTGANDGPVASNVTVGGTEDTDVTGQLTATDVDTPQDELTFSLAENGGPEHGIVTVNADGSYTYTPNENYNGTDSFTYQVDDGQGGTTTAEVSIDLTAVNDGPVAADDTGTTSEDESLIIDAAALLANDSDLDGDTLVISGVSNPVGGTVALDDDGNVVFTPTPNFNGEATFDYTVSDGNGGTDVASVTVNVAGVPDAAIIGGVTSDSVDEDTDVPAGGQLTIEDADGVAQESFRAGTAEGEYGDFTVSETGEWTYTLRNGDDNVQALDDGSSETETFTVLSADGTSQSITVTVTGTNDAPEVTGATSFDVDEDGSVLITESALLANASDDDTGDFLTVVDLAASGGTLTDNNDGTWTFEPADDFNGTIDLTYNVSDGTDKTPATGTIDVAAVNDAPVAGGASATTNEDSLTVTIDLADQISDVEDVDGALTINVDTGNSGWTATVTGTVVTLTATAAAGDYQELNEGGSVQVPGITYTVTDSDNATSDPAVLGVTVTGSNDGPVASADTASTVEDTSVTINASSLLANDTDVDSSTLTLSSVGNASGGTVSIDDAGNVVFTPEDNFNGDATFDYTIADGDGGFSTATVTVSVTPTNDGPDISIDIPGQTPSYTENQPAIRIANSAKVDDLDSENFDGGSLTVSLSGDVDNGDALSLNGPAHGVTLDGTNVLFQGTVVGTLEGGTNGDDMVITFNAEATPDAAEALIKSVTFSNDNDALPDGDRTATFTITDGDGGTDSATTDFIVKSANDEPVAADDTIAATEDTALTIDAASLIANDSDIDGDDLSISSVSNAVGGTVSLNDDGDVVFTPTANFNGTATFDYTVSDGEGGTDVATVTVNVASVPDDAIIGGTNTLTIDEDLETEVGASLTIEDGDAGEAYFVATTADGLYGSFELDADGNWTYTPSGDAGELTTGVDYIEVFNVESADGTTQSIQVTITGSDDIAQITGQTTATATEDTNESVGGKLHVEDEDKGEEAFKSDSSSGQYGDFEVAADGSWTYVLDPSAQSLAEGQQATEIFTVETIDGTQEEVTVSIVGTNDVPSITGAVAGAVIEDVRNSIEGKLTVDDVDMGESLFNAETLEGDYGSLTIDADGNWSYELSEDAQALDGGETATDVITVTTADGTTQDVTISITGTNDAAQIGGVTSGAVTEDTDLSASGVLTISDADGAEQAIFQAGSAQGEYGTFSVNANGEWSFSLNNGADNVQALAQGTEVTETFKVMSGDGTEQAVTVTISGTNDAPVATGTAFSVAEDGSVIISEEALLDNASDIDTDAAFLTVVNPTVSGGTLTDNNDGTWTFEPADDFNGTINLTYDVSDGMDATAVTSTIDVTAVNDAPTAGDASGSAGEDSLTVTIDLADKLGDVEDADAALTIVVDTGDSGWTATVTGTVVTLTATAGSYEALGVGDSADISGITYTVTDTNGASDSGAIGITVNGANDGPVAGNVTVSGDEDNVVTGQLTATDVDTPQADLTFSLADDGGPSSGSVTVNADGSYTYTPNPDFNGVDSFTYQVDDGEGGTTTATVTVNVDAVADDAVITGDTTGTTTEDVTLTSTGRLSISDADGESEEVFSAGTTQGTYGSFEISANGDWTFTLDNDSTDVQSLGAGESVTETFTVTSADGTEQSVSVVVNGTNDGPVPGDVSLSTVEDTSIVITASQLLAGATDADGDTLSVSNLTVDSGAIVDNGDGTWTFTPAADATADVSIGYDISDGTTTVSTSADMAITPVNDGPTASDSTVTGTEDVTVTGQLVAEDVDNDAGDLTYSLTDTGAPSNGTVTVNADGSYSYTPNENFSGSDSFTYQVDDGAGGTTTATVNLTVDAVADTPALTMTVSDVIANVPSVTITNLSSNAGFDNTYGYYYTDTDGNPVSGEVIWDDVSSSRDLGDSFTIEGVDPDRIGFFLLSDGDEQNRVSDGTDVEFQQVDGEWKVFKTNGQELTAHSSGGLFFSDSSLNPDGAVQMVDNGVEGNQNWEDLSNGDGDFNDFNATVEWSGSVTYDYPLNITSALTDTDGSESLVIMIGNLPDGATLSAGTEQADGTWELTVDDLSGLVLTVPDGTADFSLAVTATSTEESGDSAAITLIAPVDVPDSPYDVIGDPADGMATKANSGIGNDAEDGITEAADVDPGNSGDNNAAGDQVKEGTDGQDLIEGTTGDDHITGNDGDDYIVGGRGDDIIAGGEGSDRIFGDQGNDLVIFDGEFDDYDVSFDSQGNMLVTEKESGDVDTLLGIETVEFEDKTFDIVGNKNSRSLEETTHEAHELGEDGSYSSTANSDGSTPVDDSGL